MHTGESVIVSEKKLKQFLNHIAPRVMKFFAQSPSLRNQPHWARSPQVVGWRILT